MEPRPFHKILCANRGEIAIRVFRACTEMGIRTVAVFSEEDATNQHRYKADESYLIGRGKGAVAAYLGGDEIINTAKRAKVDAIHPGYGFLSEQHQFAAAVRAAGMAFLGPSAHAIQFLGDKVEAKKEAARLGIPTVPGMELPADEAAALRGCEAFFRANGTTIVKAAHGGGGRGMRVVDELKDLPALLRQARSESLAAFGSPVVFLEKFLPRVRHVEVQVLGDLAGNLVHLHERDCSVQRRHQKVVEVAPAPDLPEPVRRALFADALALARAGRYHNAGTFEFLVAGDKHYFIEVNPRLQVEHTVTEQITGIDLVQAQIRIEQGYDLASPEIGIWSQKDVQPRGFAIQCRITTEDPQHDFLPDTGTIMAYRAPGGFGLRLDGGDGLAGTVVSGHYDSLLVKCITYGPTLEQAAQKGLRALREFRIRGVKTNLAFLQNVLEHETFLHGKTWTRFLDDTPQLFDIPRSKDRATKLLTYLADIVVNGHPTVRRDQRLQPASCAAPPMPALPTQAPPPGSAQILAEGGPAKVVEWIKRQKRPLLTDTTMRDAHQSLLATRVRTRDMMAIAPATAFLCHPLFSLETWGGATFDVAYRFLNEDPWDRLQQFKRAIPNVLHQMLLRGANAVGYTSYPQNVVEAFIDEAALAGIDVFRVFDSLNDLDSMAVSVERVLRTGKIAEVAVCYTGDVDNPARTKYGVDYYVELVRRIEDMGAHILCVKDMAGLLRPQAARILISRLRDTTELPIHLHTHDTSGNGIATYIAAIECGAHIVDVALAPMAGLTSQPSMNALIAAMRGHSRETGLTNKAMQPLADYWEAVREWYAPFECGLKSSTSEVYFHEIPGGQYSNLRPQVASLGLLHRWSDVKYAFAVVNRLCGDIPKVTPSSKMVGDFAVFLIQNDLLTMRGDLAASTEATKQKLLLESKRLDFPQSVVQYFQGLLGNPPGGFPGDLREAVLKGLPVLQGRPSDGLPPFDFVQATRHVTERMGVEPAMRDVVSYALYPRVLDDFFAFQNRYGDVSILPTPAYFYGLEKGQEVWIEIEPGKTLVVSLEAKGEPDAEGDVTVYFKLNGQNRQVTVPDRSLVKDAEARRRADPAAAGEVGAPMPGRVIVLHCREGQNVPAGEPLLTLEAMKMETIVRAPVAGTVRELCTDVKSQVKTQDLLVVIDTKA
ncbi:MAG TPA: pyruvate carboxylase [Planctomycetota bacterium]|nr:pyruvate carboxylase [Planctomycetota bacterium]